MGRGGEKQTEFPPDLLDRRDIARVLEVTDAFDALGKRIAPQGIWSCDGGAMVLSEMLFRANILHSIEVGLYHYSEERLPYRYRQIFLVEDDYQPSDKELDDVRDAPEHHHWVIAGELLIDPNGEIRGEPRIQLASETEAYQESEDDSILEFSPLWDPESGLSLTIAEYAEEDEIVRLALAELQR